MPDNPEQVLALSGARPKFNSRGHVQLRFEAVDAPETHYSPPLGGGNFHQPLNHAEAARSDLLSYLGFRNVVWSANKATVVSADDGQPGYILSREVEKNGRPVAFVFAGAPPVGTGNETFFDVAKLKQSYNYRSISSGLSYATFYTGLFFDLRNSLIEAATAAREAKLGIYEIDVTQSGFDGNNLDALCDTVGIMPKLFRRVVEYVSNTGSIAGFKDKMEEYAEPVLDLVQSNFTHFDDMIDQQGSTIKLLRTPEQMVFDAMPARPVDAFSELLAEDATIPGNLPPSVVQPGTGAFI
jgi:hypothetical protein